MWWGGSTHCQTHKLNAFWDMCIFVYAHLRKKSNYTRDPSDYPPGKWAFYLIFLAGDFHDTQTHTTAWRFVCISQRWYQFQSNGCSWWSMMWRTLCVFLERKLQEAILENRWLPKRSLPFVISVGGVPWKTEIFFESLSVVSFNCPMMQPYLLISCMFVCWVQCSWRFCYQCQRCVVLVLFIPGKLLYTSLKLEFFWDNPQRLTNPFHRVIPGFESTGWY